MSGETKRGRPTASNPIDKHISVNVDAATAQQLNDYCDKWQVSKASVVRRALKMLLESDNAQ